MSNFTFEQLEDLTFDWGLDKGILPFPDPLAQLAKTREEVDELEAAIRTEDAFEALDAVGDILVTLIMQSGYWNFTLTEALEQAYNTISQRTGKMVNGQFVKDN